MAKTSFIALALALSVSSNASAVTYHFVGTPISPNTSYISVTGTLNLPDNFSLPATATYGSNLFLPAYGYFESFATRTDGAIDRGRNLFGFSNYVNPDGSFSLGGALGAISFRGTPFNNLAGLGGASALFNVSNFTSVTASIYGQEDRPYDAPNTIRESFTVTSFTDVSAVPEPATWTMMILGMGAVGGALRRRQKTTTRVVFAV